MKEYIDYIKTYVVNWWPEQSICAALVSILSHPIISYKEFKEWKEEEDKKQIIEDILKEIRINNYLSYSNHLRKFFIRFIENRAWKSLKDLKRDELDNLENDLKEFFKEKIIYIRDQIFQNPTKYIMEYKSSDSWCFPYISLRKDTFQQLIDELFSSYTMTPDFDKELKTQIYYLITMSNVIRSAFNSVLKEHNYFKKRKDIAPKYYNWYEWTYRSDRDDKLISDYQQESIQEKNRELEIDWENLPRRGININWENMTALKVLWWNITDEDMKRLEWVLNELFGNSQT